MYIFHQETMIKKKWLFILFAICKMKTVNIHPSTFCKKKPVTTAMLGLGLLDLLVQFEFMVMS